MRKLIVLGACLLALGVYPSVALAADPEVVVVRVYEQLGSPSRLVISRGAGKTEVLDFPNGYSEKNVVAAAELYHRIVTQLYQEGYVLQGTLKSGDISGTMLFVKAAKP